MYGYTGIQVEGQIQELRHFYYQPIALPFHAWQLYFFPYHVLSNFGALDAGLVSFISASV